ncbi:histidine phosphatase family protein [Azospirillum rugosum]|uniref:Phosphoglycerate mutase n=1 Tax=Azospirillum rugosum TaxID=416170 RepID=A0ABS4SNU2_9PROT|nr:histidine phosphatase family protein [Azospirillum rugosum]MBP2294228.1 putative phosphoglycerate mutase [Azospirillum rugosum]MDQ0527383.1 putative phosphoglycerate mutase [Azospirillum rugosum]
MTILYLVRHADHDWIGRGIAGRMDTSLNDTGRQQAERLGRWFARERAAGLWAGGQQVTGLWASPLPRTQQTAEPIARALGLPIQTADALLEVEFGAWTGRDFPDLDADPAWRQWNGARSLARAPGGETTLEVQARMVGFLNRLCADDPGGIHVLVSHGDAIRAALAYYLGVPIDLFLRIEVSPASISVLAIDGWTPKVLRLNGSSDDGSMAPAS